MGRPKAKRDSPGEGQAGLDKARWQDWPDGAAPSREDLAAGLRTLAAVGAAWLDRAPKGNLDDREQRGRLTEVLGLLDEMAACQRRVAEDLAFVQLREELARLVPSAARAKLLKELAERAHGPIPEEIPPNVHFDDVWLCVAQRRVQAELGRMAPENPKIPVLKALLRKFGKASGQVFDSDNMMSVFPNRSSRAGGRRSIKGAQGELSASAGQTNTVDWLGNRRAAVSPSWRTQTYIEWTPESLARDKKHPPDAEDPRSYARFDPIAGVLLSGIENVRRLCPWLGGLSLQVVEAVAIADGVRASRAQVPKNPPSPKLVADAAILILQAKCGYLTGAMWAEVANMTVGAVLADCPKLRGLTERLNRALAWSRHADEPNLQEVDLGQYFCARASGRPCAGGQDRAEATLGLLLEAATATARRSTHDLIPDHGSTARANRWPRAAISWDDTVFWAEAARGANTTQRRADR